MKNNSEILPVICLLDLYISFQVDAVSPPSLCHLIDKCGANLRRLVIAENQFKAFNVILNNLMVKFHVFEYLVFRSGRYYMYIQTNIP